MIFNATIEESRWRKGTSAESEVQTLEMRREILLQSNSVGIFSIVLLGVVGLFMFYVAPFMLGDAMGLTQEAVEGLLPLPLVVLSIFGLYLLNWCISSLWVALAQKQWWVRLHLAFDKLSGTPIFLGDCHVQERVFTPVEIEISEDEEGGFICWRAVGDERVEIDRIVQNDTETELPEGARRRQHIEGRCSVSEGSRPFFELTRAFGEDILFLNCRNAQLGNDDGGISMSFGRPDWMSNEAFDALPCMTREAAWIEPDEAHRVMKALYRVSLELGRPIAALAPCAVVAAAKA